MGKGSSSGNAADLTKPRMVPILSYTTCMPHLQCAYSKCIDISSSGLSGCGQLWSGVVETICLLGLCLDMLVDGIR